MRTTAIIVAAGRGERLGGEVPKQFRTCAGRPVAAHALSRFCRAEGIDEIVLVLPDPRDLDDHLGGAAAWSLPFTVVKGGDDRQDSVAAGLSAVSGEGLVLVHDGVRPLVPVSLIEDVRKAAAVTGAAVPACRCTETIKMVRGGRVRTTLDRSQLVRAQTPQGFRTGLLREAHRRAAEDGVRSTDDAALVERLGVPVAVVEGSPGNIKITCSADLELAADLLRREAEGGGTTGSEAF
jgi:2-C-methyl-D-erythritol 4-phosphate cytidylyltransferase